MKTVSLTALFLAFGIATGTAQADGHATAPVSEANCILVDKNDMSLYTFDPDTSTSSACNDGCAEAWPPLIAPADSDELDKFTSITRDDGTRQWVYDGKPLYLWVNDQQPGDTTGDGVNDVWHLARP
ncbi:COG4315 family predicted lipoprotein [Sulfitobacter pacificus]|uniref:Lipoprotein with Yx(FWY)xxD motif n=1 Tax=Sulfitobacter pacificus TaxID=1499314 RepID=A0ABQ5VDQ1_9RHOB|nr:hypothetical protein [Sulfitobacter pacificus]GLQ25636.1 hypothetical protein GCM10007927_04390 [Sulfitobacter pacificus]